MSVIVICLLLHFGYSVIDDYGENMGFPWPTNPEVSFEAELGTVRPSPNSCRKDIDLCCNRGWALHVANAWKHIFEDRLAWYYAVSARRRAAFSILRPDSDDLAQYEIYMEADFANRLPYRSPYMNIIQFTCWFIPPRDNVLWNAILGPDVRVPRSVTYRVNCELDESVETFDKFSLRKKWAYFGTPLALADDRYFVRRSGGCVTREERAERDAAQAQAQFQARAEAEAQAVLGLRANDGHHMTAFINLDSASSQCVSLPVQSWSRDLTLNAVSLSKVPVTPVSNFQMDKAHKRPRSSVDLPNEAPTSSIQSMQMRLNLRARRPEPVSQQDLASTTSSSSLGYHRSMFEQNVLDSLPQMSRAQYQACVTTAVTDLWPGATFQLEARYGTENERSD